MDLPRHRRRRPHPEIDFRGPGAYGSCASLPTTYGIYNDYAPRFVPHPGHDNNILYPGPNKGGLEFFGHLMHRASESVETNQEFLDVMQALFIPDSAIKANHYPLTKSKLQGDNYAISPGMDGWDATWREGNMDQSHHLMAFVLTGYGHQNTPSVATAKSDLLERHDAIKNGRRFNMEDARLGDMGSNYGSLLGYNEKRCGSGKKWSGEKAYRKHWIDSLIYRLGRKSTYRD